MRSPNSFAKRFALATNQATTLFSFCCSGFQVHDEMCSGVFDIQARQKIRRLDKEYQKFSTFVHTVFSRLNAPGVYLKFGSFNPAFFRGRRLIGVRRLLTKCHFQPFFHVDLLLSILGNLGAFCQCWRIFPFITRS